jgi:hypothetical protein
VPNRNGLWHTLTRWWRGPTHSLLAIALAWAVVAEASLGGQVVTQPALKAAFLYNFAKFAEWPSDAASTTPLTLCVIDDNAVDDALSQLVRGSVISGRPVAVQRGRHDRLRACHLAYFGGTDADRAIAMLDEIKGAPVLTVSDGEQFARMGGVIGLFLEDGKMRFAVNADAAQRGGVRLSSRLLTLAKLVKDLRHVQP